MCAAEGHYFTVSERVPAEFVTLQTPRGEEFSVMSVGEGWREVTYVLECEHHGRLAWVYQS